MRTPLMGKYEMTQKDGSVRIDLKHGHTVLYTYPGKGEYRDISSIGFGDCGCDLCISENRNGLVCGYSELSFGRTSGAAIALADMGSGVCRAGSESGPSGGEVSVIVLLGPSFSVSSMARAGITAAEAITAAVQDLGLRDPSDRPGSGTSNLRMAVVSDTGSDIRLRGTGKHSKMGEIIGRTVHDSVMGSAMNNGIALPDPDAIVRRLAGRGYTDEGILERFSSASGALDSVKERLRTDELLKAGFSSLSLLNDEISWGLIPEKEGREVGCRMVESLLGRCCDNGGDLLDVFASSLFGD